VLLISVFTTLLSYLVLWLTGSIWRYLGARIINGVAAGNVSSIQSILSDISIDHKDRTANFGRFGAIFGVGFIVGPAL